MSGNIRRSDLHPEFNDELNSVTSQLAEMKYYVTPEMFGAKGDYYLSDGSINPNPTDDTSAIQQAINSGNIVYLSKTYLVSKTADKYIELKGASIPISITIPSNRKIFITGSIVTNAEFNVFYSEGENIQINGGEFLLADLNLTTAYRMGCVALNKAKLITIEKINTNNAIATCFSCNYITARNNISSRISNKTINAAIGFHNTSHSQMVNNIIVGTHSDGDLICFGACTDNIIDGNSLFAKSDYWEDLGAQGICLDTGCYKCKVINNYATGYYNPIDVKTWANGNIISGNTLYANKQGITIRRGEGNQLNYTDIISNNLIDLGGGNGDASPVLGSVGITEETYTVCGIMVESASNVLITDNVIYTTSAVDHGIGIMLNDIMDNNTIKIDNNKFQACYTETYQYFQGVFIMSNGSSIKNCWLTISNNEFFINDVSDTTNQYFNIRYIANVTISNNVYTGGRKTPLISHCSNVYISGNTGVIVFNMAKVEYADLLLYTGNSMLNVGWNITHVLDVFNVTNSISSGNSIFSQNVNFVDTGCANKNDVIVHS